MRREQPLLPFDPLERYFGRPEFTDTDLAIVIGVERTRIKDWREKGIRFYTADRVVTNLGFHPSYFWPEEYWTAPLGKS